MRLDRDLGIEIVQPLARSAQFRLADLRCAVENLPVKICDVDIVEIGETDPTDSRRREIHRNWAAQTARPDDEDRGVLQLLLAFFANFRQNEMTRVSFALGLGEHHLSLS